MYNRSRWKAKMEFQFGGYAGWIFRRELTENSVSFWSRPCARQLQSGTRPLIQIPSKRATRIAQAEVQAGLVPFRVEEPDKLDLPRQDRTRSTKSGSWPAGECN
jgi:hypothetical protein